MYSVIQQNITPDAARDAGQIEITRYNYLLRMQARTTPVHPHLGPRVNIYKAAPGSAVFNLLVNLATEADALRQGFTAEQFAEVASFTPTEPVEMVDLMATCRAHEANATRQHDEHKLAPAIVLPPKTHGPVTRATHCKPAPSTAPLIDRVEIVDANDATRRITLERCNVEPEWNFPEWKSRHLYTSQSFDLISAALRNRRN